MTQSSDDISPGLKRKLLEALNMSAAEPEMLPDVLPPDVPDEAPDGLTVDYDGMNDERDGDEYPVYELQDEAAGDGESPYAILHREDEVLTEPPMTEDLQDAARRLETQLAEAQNAIEQGDSADKMHTNLQNSGTLVSKETGPVGNEASTEELLEDKKPETRTSSAVSLTEKEISGGPMADLSGYKDLSKAPISLDEDEQDIPAPTPGGHDLAPAPTDFRLGGGAHGAGDFGGAVDTEFSGNVKKLIQLVNDLPDSVTRQDGASVIRLTMEAMGVAMEDVLSEAQSAQSEMLDAVRANIKKIEEYKTVIRKLETDIKYYQGKANELSEIIDLFILSNTSGQNVPNADDLG